MSKPFTPTGKQYYRTLHIFWDTKSEPRQISEIRLIRPHENPRLYDAHFMWSATIFQDADDGPTWRDDDSNAQAMQWGVEGYLLGLVMSYGGLSPLATDMLRYDLGRLKVNGWNKVETVPRSKSLFNVREWERQMVMSESVQKIIADDSPYKLKP